MEDINLLVGECSFGSRFEYVSVVKYLSNELAQ